MVLNIKEIFQKPVAEVDKKLGKPDHISENEHSYTIKGAKTVRALNSPVTSVIIVFDKKTKDWKEALALVGITNYKGIKAEKADGTFYLTKVPELPEGSLVEYSAKGDSIYFYENVGG